MSLVSLQQRLFRSCNCNMYSECTRENNFQKTNNINSNRLLASPETNTEVCELARIVTILISNDVDSCCGRRARSIHSTSCPSCTCIGMDSSPQAMGIRELGTSYWNCHESGYARKEAFTGTIFATLAKLHPEMEEECAREYSCCHAPSVP